MTEKKKNLGLDEIVSIEDVGIINTYDFTIPETHCFFANDVLVHNSLEEDADIVLMGHRPYLYPDGNGKRDNNLKDYAEWEVAKNRQGAEWNIKCVWQEKHQLFQEIAVEYDNKSAGDGKQ